MQWLDPPLKEKDILYGTWRSIACLHLLCEEGGVPRNIVPQLHKVLVTRLPKLVFVDGNPVVESRQKARLFIAVFHRE